MFIITGIPDISNVRIRKNIVKYLHTVLKIVKRPGLVGFVGKFSKNILLAAVSSIEIAIKVNSAKTKIKVINKTYLFTE
jgi:H2-forming N5,N10-methylenetetrahydromethanopterin dehydrogenase-like enzyme